MNPYRFLTRGLIIIAALGLGALGLHAFEGRVDMTLKTNKDKAPMPMSYFMKGTRMRTEMEIEQKRGSKEAPQRMVSIVNLQTGEVTTLMPEQKMYMVMKIDQIAGAAQNGPVNNPFKPTGRKEVIAGVEAEEYAGMSDRKWTEIWVTKELGSFMMGGGAQAKGKPSAWEDFVKRENLFSLRVVVRPKQGAAEEFRMETIKVDKSKLSDSLFVPPADYQRFEMPGMGDLLKGMMP